MNKGNVAGDYSGVIKNKDIYNLKFKENTDFTYEPVLDLVINIVEKGNYKTILDYGCGTGRFGFYLRKRLKDIKLIGIDISDEGLKFCSSFYDEIYLTDGLTLPDIKFDFVLLNSVIEHIPLCYWDIFFKGIFNKLEIKGSIFIITPNKDSFHRKFTDNWSEQEEKEEGHISIVELGYLKRKLKEYGFEKLKTSFLFIPKELPQYMSIPHPFKNIIKFCYIFLHIYPLYYIKNSFWILTQKCKLRLTFPRKSGQHEELVVDPEILNSRKDKDV